MRTLGFEFIGSLVSFVSLQRGKAPDNMRSRPFIQLIDQFPNLDFFCNGLFTLSKRQ